MSIISGGYDQPRVAYRRLGSIAELSLAAPSRNLLVARLRAALLAALDQALLDPEITGIVVCADGGQFSHGGDLAEVGHETSPTVAELCSRLENASKCVVALIDGNAFGAGLELALAAHYRLAGRDANLAMPAIAAGQVPAAGATQRLPRLIGVSQTLDMLLGGTPVSAMQAAACGLVDVVLAGSRKQRLAQARKVAGELPPRPTMARPMAEQAGSSLRALRAARAALDPNAGPAAACIIDCVEAAQLLSCDQGLGFESANAATLAARPETEALKYAYRAALRAAALPAAIRAAALPLPDQITVWGAGPEALSLVGQALARRIRVTLVEPRRDLLLAGIERIAAAEEAEYLAGRLNMEERDARWSCLTPTLAPEALSAAEAGAVYASGEGLPPPAGIRAVSLLGLAHARQLGAGGVTLCPASVPGQTAELALFADYSVGLAGSAVALAHRLGWRIALTSVAAPDMQMPTAIHPGADGNSVGRRLRQTLAAVIAEAERAGQDAGLIASALAGWGLATVPRRLSAPTGAAGQELVRRCLLALANEGARMIDEGLASSASVVDAVAVGTGLFPRLRGGPMFLADRRGLMIVRASLDELAKRNTALYQPSPLILRLLHEGRGFVALN